MSVDDGVPVPDSLLRALFDEEQVPSVATMSRNRRLDREECMAWWTAVGDDGRSRNGKVTRFLLLEGFVFYDRLI